MHKQLASPDGAAPWRQLATRVAQLGNRLPDSAVGEPSAASTWLQKVQKDCLPVAPAVRTRAACLSQRDYAQETVRHARAMLLAAAGSDLLSCPETKKTVDGPQVPAPGTDSSGKE